MRNRNEIKEAITNDKIDWFGRSDFIKSFSDYLINQKGSSHICINGVWGSGKTTTVLGIIDYLKRNCDADTPIVLYLDAWRYENYEHPLFSLLKVIESEAPNIMELIRTEFSALMYKVQFGINLPFFGLNISRNREDLNEQFLNKAEYIDALNNLLIKAVQIFKAENNSKMIIFIDELDRAKPEFALRMFEMFHHLQDELPTHVVYSVDMLQLNNMIRHYYGYQYNVEIFTHKVFDTIINLQKLTSQNLSNYLKSNLSYGNRIINEDHLVELILSHLSLEQMESLRTINRICERIQERFEIGYFDLTDQSRRSRLSYFLEDSSNEYFWGYLEVLVALEVLRLNHPIEVKGMFKGKNIELLANQILDNSSLEMNSNIKNLILSSFNHNKESSTKIASFEMLSYENVVVALRHIIQPHLTNTRVKSVFSQNDF